MSKLGGFSGGTGKAQGGTGGVRGGGGGGNAGGYRAPQQRAVDIKQLPFELQVAFELLQSLKALGEDEDRVLILEQAGVADELNVNVLASIAALYERRGMPLSQRGIMQFKLERALPGGPSVAGTVARSFARALLGDEILIPIKRIDEMALSATERATLRALRAYAQVRGGRDIVPLKKALGLRNPPVPFEVEELANEYIGVHGIKAIAHFSTHESLSLDVDGLDELVRRAKSKRPPPAPGT